jgi:hypothetical protein
MVQGLVSGFIFCVCGGDRSVYTLGHLPNTEWFGYLEVFGLNKSTCCRVMNCLSQRGVDYLSRSLILNLFSLMIIYIITCKLVWVDL